MTKEDFLKELENNLKLLSNKEREEELNKYKDLASIENLSPMEIANEIYQKKGIKNPLNNIKFLDAANILVNNLQNKDKAKLKNILLFFLYMFIIVILIKVPFIYVRDIITNIFNDTFQNDRIYTLWVILFELLYAITSIIVFVKNIKNKALELKKDTN